MGPRIGWVRPSQRCLRTLPGSLAQRHAARLDELPIRSTAELTRKRRGDFAEVLGRMLSNTVLLGRASR